MKRGTGFYCWWFSDFLELTSISITLRHAACRICWFIQLGVCIEQCELDSDCKPIGPRDCSTGPTVIMGFGIYRDRILVAARPKSHNHSGDGPRSRAGLEAVSRLLLSWYGCRKHGTISCMVHYLNKFASYKTVAPQLGFDLIINWGRRRNHWS